MVGVLVIALTVAVGYLIVHQSHAANADINGDGTVNILDLSILAAHYNKTGQTFSTGDINGDGVVNILDLSILAAAWGSSVSTTCQSVAVPAYFYPAGTGNPWPTAVAAAPGVSIMIANPASGPGTSIDPNYTSAIASAKAAGIRVFGYVDTSFAALSSASVETNVNTWKNLYGVTDIFFDEASSAAGDEPYYQTLDAYVHGQTAGSLVILNPGTVPDQSYMNAGDIIAIFENNTTVYQTATFPAWIHNFAPSRFLAIVYNVPDQTSMTAVLSKAAQNGIAYAYATNDNLPNPYDTVPPYLAAEAGQARNNCSL